MKHLPLRARIILGLIILALGATLAVGLVTANFLSQTPQISTSPEMHAALQDALELAKRDYETRKQRLAALERRLLSDSDLRERIGRGDQQAITQLLGSDSDRLSVRIDASGQADGTSDRGISRLDGERTLLELRILTTDVTGAPTHIIVSDELSELLRIEEALQTYSHLEMFIADLREGLVLNYVLIVVVMVVLAGLIGLRIGLGITGPLSSLIRGTRELARDNLNYRIPPGRNDEIGMLIDSFNHMAGDLEENRRKRVEAEKVAAWREIARRLAHEIKNPLTPIQLTVQQMRDKYPGSDSDYQKLLNDCAEIVTEEVESLRGLVQEFAEFARMPQLALTAQDLNTVIVDTVKLYSERKVELDLQENLPKLRLDLEGIRRVLINLVQNAIDASDETSTVRIQTERRDRWIYLSIMDEGHGIEQADRELIFEPYISNKEEGTGLGLAMVRSIVQEHGGKITVSGSPSGGARFDIELPTSERSVAPKENTQ
jgi:nitrogen fixation/metabolism regulation signal transduction histidine kinase